jgi:hypothetical protein
MKTIQLTRGKVAIVDDEDYESLSKHKWCFNIGYAARGVKKNGKQSRIWMHRVINKTPKGMVTDHIDGNGLNNQKSNLRSCTHYQNIHNTKMHKDNASGMKGISWSRRDKRWQAQIMVKGQRISLGSHTTAQSAYAAYCDACTKLHGDFARVA